MGSDLPLYPYKKYPHNILNIAHSADEWIPLIAMIYTALLFILYCQQYVTRRRLWFSPSTISLHRIGLISLFILFLYELLMYLLSNNYYKNVSNSCDDYIRLLFISFVLVKYAMIFCIVLNLSYINQNPFINPRYKYIGKRSRIRLKRFFNILIIIVAIFLIVGVYGAWIHAESEEYNDSPNNFSYCTQTLSVFEFFFTFIGDILGFLLFSCLFGRNACELCRRKVRPNQKHKYDDGNLSDVGDYDDDKHYDYNKIEYDIDDPIRNKLASDMKYSVNHDGTSVNTSREIKNASSVKKDVYGGYTDNLIVNINEDSDDDYFTKMNKDKNKIKKIKQSTLIEAEELISDEEIDGIREQKRVLQLIWIMLIAYWINILLLILLGLFENVACLTLMISSSCIILLNDYEFGSTYWKFRAFICKIGSCLCCICRKTYFFNHCFCGKEKIYKDNFDPTAGYKNKFDHDDNVPNEYKKFVRL